MDAFVDGSAIRDDLFGLVVRIEEEIVARMKRTITRTVFSEKKCFKEPSRVGEMPFGRAAIGN